MCSATLRAFDIIGVSRRAYDATADFKEEASWESPEADTGWVAVSTFRIARMLSLFVALLLLPLHGVYKSIVWPAIAVANTCMLTSLVSSYSGISPLVLEVSLWLTMSGTSEHSVDNGRTLTVRVTLVSPPTASYTYKTTSSWFSANLPSGSRVVTEADSESAMIVSKAVPTEVDLTGLTYAKAYLRGIWSGSSVQPLAESLKSVVIEIGSRPNPPTGAASNVPLVGA
jgi:hypothetical protein